MAGTWVTDLTPGGPYGLVGSPIQVLGLGLSPGQWDWSLSQGSVSRRHWDADTGMPTHWDATHWDVMAGSKPAKEECILAQGHWDAMAGS